MQLHALHATFILSSLLACAIFSAVELGAPHLRLDGQRPASLRGAAVSLRNLMLTSLVMHAPLPFPVNPADGTLRAGACILVWIVAADVWFGTLHRCMHMRWLYPLHRRHHTDTTPPTSVDTFACSCVEQLLVNGGSAMAGPLLFPGTVATTHAWIVIYVAGAVAAHSNLRWCGERHAVHHLYRNVNFGNGFFVVDRILNTRV